MELALNAFALFYIVVITLGTLLGTGNNREPQFYLRLIIMIIPALATLRQILVITDQLSHYPFYIYVVYLLLRTLGPLLNYYAHLVSGKQINFFSSLNIITYILVGYILYDMFYVITLPENDQYPYIKDMFSQQNWFSFTYPVLQLAHVIQGLYIIEKHPDKSRPTNVIYFMRIGMWSVSGLLIILQLGYFLLARTEVELILAPIIFIIAFTIILLASLRYSSILGGRSQLDLSLLKFDALTDREHEVLSLIAEGYTDKEIGEKLHLSMNTIKTYIKRIYTKLEVKNRVEAVTLAIKISPEAKSPK